jgi:hypothetical protein
MKVKTDELTGPALDWAVNQIEECCDDPWTPLFSTNWSQGGPIIERERIGIEPWGSELTWLAQTYNEAGRVLHRQYGPTPLIAAMRCYVAAHLGNEVEVPEELK